MLGFEGKALEFSSFSFSFYFLLFLFFTSFYFGIHIGLLFMGVLNLLKVVNETRVSYCKAYEARQFFRLLKKSDVHSVWLAKGGRKRVESKKSSTDYPLN